MWRYRRSMYDMYIKPITYCMCFLFALRTLLCANIPYQKYIIISVEIIADYLLNVGFLGRCLLPVVTWLMWRVYTREKCKIVNC